MIHLELRHLPDRARGTLHRIVGTSSIQFAIEDLEFWRPGPDTIKGMFDDKHIFFDEALIVNQYAKLYKSKGISCCRCFTKTDRTNWIFL